MFSCAPAREASVALPDYRRAGSARIDLAANIAGTVTEREAEHARQVLAQRRQKKLAVRATITSRRFDAGESANPNKTEGYGAPSCASVAKGVRLRHEKYLTP